MRQWLQAVPKPIRILVLLSGMLASVAIGSYATAAWIGWQDLSPGARFARLELADSTQTIRDAQQDARRDSLSRALTQLGDSLGRDLRGIRADLRAVLKLECAQLPSKYRPLADGRCP